MLDGHVTGPVDHVGPAVAQVTELVDLAAVVTLHIAPDLARAVVTEAPVELDVKPPFGQDDVEIFGAVLSPPALPGPHWHR